MRGNIQILVGVYIEEYCWLLRVQKVWLHFLKISFYDNMDDSNLFVIKFTEHVVTVFCLLCLQCICLFTFEMNCEAEPPVKQNDQ